jgi:hypothetical protein
VVSRLHNDVTDFKSRELMVFLVLFLVLTSQDQGIVADALCQVLDVCFFLSFFLSLSLSLSFFLPLFMSFFLVLFLYMNHSILAVWQTYEVAQVDWLFQRSIFSSG